MKIKKKVLSLGCFFILFTSAFASNIQAIQEPLEKIKDGIMAASMPVCIIAIVVAGWSFFTGEGGGTKKTIMTLAIGIAIVTGAASIFNGIFSQTGGALFF